MERPLLIVTFQGVLGDFMKDGGISTKQEHLMSKQYLKELNMNEKGYNNSAAADSPNYHMWVRLGALDGMRYLSKHFQIVVFNRKLPKKGA